MWCPQDPAEMKAIEELEAIFPPMLKDMINVDHLMASTTATMMELAWTGIRGEIIVSHIRFFRSTLALGVEREEKKLLISSLERAEITDGIPAHPDAQKPDHKERLVHYRPLQEGELETGAPTWGYRWTLQLGSNIPREEYILNRVNAVAGLQFDTAIGKLVDGKVEGKT